MTCQGLRVLVVEDDALISMMLEEFLAELGCEVVASVGKLSEGVSQANSLAMDVAVLDVNLAGELSYPIAQILHARRIPFMFATGYGVDGLPGDLKGAQILSKPYDLAQLESALLRLAPPAVT